MSELDWLMYANIAVWIGLAGYLAFMARSQSRLEQRLTALEEEVGDSHA